MTRFFRDFLNDENGAAAAEYALILAIVGASIAAGAATLGNAVSSAMGRSSNCIATNGTTC
jgi:pilus assembly protein Flp/PilA